MTISKRALEANARGAARRVGLIARKSRQRAHVPNLDNFGDFMLVDGETGFVINGSRFDLPADDVVAFCKKYGEKYGTT